LVSHLFTADPSAKVFGDRVYVYTSHDADGQTGYDMVDYHAYSSDDLVNWQDHGAIIHASDLPWAPHLYAPDACEKNGKYYLYIPNSGSAIGVAVADHPGGPFIDALGEPLLTTSVPGVEDVEWLFDPACFVDSDGQAYLYFGGGPEDTGENARVVRLNDDMVSLKDTSATVIPAPEFFEASFLHKRGSTYYFSYSTNFKGHSAYLDYMTSDDPMTGFQYAGTILTNGSVNMGNNNHGSIIEFMGKSYLFYHSRKLEQDGGGDNSYQRSIALQELTYTGDNITQLAMNTEGTTVAQLRCLDGFAEVQAETIAAQSGIEVEGDGAVGVSVTDIDTGDWVGYSQVDFRDGATTFTARVASASGSGSIDVRIDGCDDFTSVEGTSIGTCSVTATGGADTFAEISCPIVETSGPHDLCLSFTGDRAFKLDSFHLE
jgi:arabinoxylan arabinofuranohydrolase